MEKPNLQDIPSIVIMFITIGITLVISVLVFQGFSDEAIDLDTYDIGNETITGELTTAVSLANDDLVSGTVVATNATGGETISDTLYTVNLPAGTFTVTDTGWDTESINVSYDYTEPHQSASYELLQEGIGGLDNISNFQPLFGLVIVASVILGLIFILG